MLRLKVLSSPKLRPELSCLSLIKHVRAERLLGMRARTKAYSCSVGSFLETDPPPQLP